MSPRALEAAAGFDARPGFEARPGFDARPGLDATPGFDARPGFDAESLLARARTENFPVALWVLPRAQRRHLRSIYGFARLADQIGDELPGNRLAALDWLEADLERACAGEPRHPLLRALALTLREIRLPVEPFRRLIEANRLDQRVRRYATWADLRAYCELSANPVGELVLHVFGAATAERVALSDEVCTALQLVEHCQDVAEDLQRGRVYLPAEDRARFQCAEADLGLASAPPALRALLRFEVARARELLDSGRPLARSLAGSARLAVAGFVAGGRAALDAIERRDFDVLAGPTRPAGLVFLRRLVQTLR